MGDFVELVLLFVGVPALVGFLSFVIMTPSLWPRIPTRKPRPIKATIEELTAHKMQHQSWVEGQRLAMQWWEQQCACPVPKTFEQDIEDWRQNMHIYGRAYNPFDSLNTVMPPMDPRYMAKRRSSHDPTYRVR